MVMDACLSARFCRGQDSVNVVLACFTAMKVQKFNFFNCSGLFKCWKYQIKLFLFRGSPVEFVQVLWRLYRPVSVQCRC